MSQGVKIILTEQQEKWMIDHYPNTTNDECAEHLGIGKTTVIRIALRMGLAKTDAHKLEVRKKAQEKAKAYHLLHPRKGISMTIPNSEKHRFKKGESFADRYGEEAEKERAKKVRETRQAIIRSERARIMFGLPQRTKIKLVRTPTKRRNQKWYLRTRGYIIDDNTRTAYYNEHTERCHIIEHRGEYFQFKPLTDTETKIYAT